MCAGEGGWLVLANLELAQSWVRSAAFERMLGVLTAEGAAGRLHAGFRLWMTSRMDGFAGFPLVPLQQSDTGPICGVTLALRRCSEGVATCAREATGASGAQAERRSGLV